MTIEPRPPKPGAVLGLVRMMPRVIAAVVSLLALGVVAQQVFLVQTNKHLRLRIASMTGEEIRHIPPTSAFGSMSFHMP
jgi:hypothetical protein